MWIRFLACLALAMAACLLTQSEADANSYGSYGGFRGPVRGVVANGIERRQERRDIRQARREARQAARGWGSAGQYGGGSAGSYGGSHGSDAYESAPAPAPTPVEETSYCPPQAEPLVIEAPVCGADCAHCRRQFLLGGNRRNPIFN